MNDEMNRRVAQGLQEKHGLPSFMGSDRGRAALKIHSQVESFGRTGAALVLLRMGEVAHGGGHNGRLGRGTVPLHCPPTKVLCMHYALQRAKLYLCSPASAPLALEPGAPLPSLP